MRKHGTSVPEKCSYYYIALQTISCQMRKVNFVQQFSSNFRTLTGESVALFSILPKFPQSWGNCHMMQNHHSSMTNHHATAMYEEQWKHWWNTLTVLVCLIPLISCFPWHSRHLCLNCDLTELGTANMEREFKNLQHYDRGG